MSEARHEWFEPKSSIDLPRSTGNPTLFVGLGSTGKIIVTRLKAKLVEESRRTGKDLLRSVRFRVIDTDPPEEAHLTDGTPVALDPATEFIGIGDVPVRDIRRQMSEGVFRESPNTWFDKNILLMEENLRKGAQQIRQLGRLALFWHLDERRNIYSNLESVVREVTDLARIMRPRSEGDSEPLSPLSVDVYIISSLGGGTGSGMLIDMAHVLQDLFHNRAQWDRVTLNAVLIMPNVVPGTRESTLRPNTLAAIRELNYFQARNDRKVIAIKDLYCQIEYTNPLFKNIYSVQTNSLEDPERDGSEVPISLVVDAFFQMLL